MAYTLNLTAEDVKTIGFVGYRYGWSDSLESLGEGENDIPESDAWEIAEAMNGDAEGGHSLFPMLDHSSDLAGKLFEFLDSIV